MGNSRSARLYLGLFDVLNRFVPWYGLPTWLGLANVHAIRIRLRERNLYPPEVPGSVRDLPAWRARFRTARTPDGSYHDLADPAMGQAGTGFGRNVPPQAVVPPSTRRELDPNPREISRRLMTRDEFKAATSLNLLAAAWIQFQVHDWFGHGLPEPDQTFKIPLSAEDDWPGAVDRDGRRVMEVGRTPRDPRTGSFFNDVTHWWDASQLYGSDEKAQEKVRAHKDGKLAMEANGLLLEEPGTRFEITGRNDNWWVGLSLLHTLFALEHNAICDRLHAEYPLWDDEQLFATARLVNAALIAKIHVLEWVPAILGHPVLRIGMSGTWWGLAGERVRRAFGRISRLDEISGIPGSTVDHHAAAYSITEEFVSVYRMHPLLPDALEVRSADGQADSTETLRLREISGRQTRDVVERFGMPNLFYSFGIAHPGMITLRNYPRDLQELEPQTGGPMIDLAAVDILRDRERGVPRYNAFRRALGLAPIRSFAELNSKYADELRGLYGGRPDKGEPDNVDDVDLMVGLYAEEPPPGFGFSDTAFRIFILMNGRRLQSDRFFTDDFTPAVYTQAGLDWIAGNDMRSVLLRHHPQLAPALHRVPNVFAPWNRVDQPLPAAPPSRGRRR